MAKLLDRDLLKEILINTQLGRQIDRQRERQREIERERQIQVQSFSNLSFHQRACADIHASQQQTSHRGFQLPNLPPPPCTVPLVFHDTCSYFGGNYQQDQFIDRSSTYQNQTGQALRIGCHPVLMIAWLSFTPVCSLFHTALADTATVLQMFASTNTCQIGLSIACAYTRLSSPSLVEQSRLSRLKNEQQTESSTM